MRRISNGLSRVVLGPGWRRYVLGVLTVGLLAVAFVEINSAYLRDFLAVSNYGTRPHRIPCDEWPTSEEVEQVLERHADMIRRIESVRPRGIGISINTWSCPGRAELYIYYPAKRQIKEIRTIIEDERSFFGVPFT